MEKHISKKFIRCILALSAGFVLASCDPVSVVPENYNHAIITSTDGEINLDGNNLGTLYDSITSERNSTIVNKILQKIAEKKFGTFKEFKDACDSPDAWKEYAKAHDEFFEFTKDGKIAEKRFENFAKDIISRISEYFYNEITSGSYNDDLGQFSEEKLYNAHKYELYDLEKPASFNTFFVDKTLTKENAYTKISFEAYALADKDERGYIKEKVYPDILKNKLVEDYIYTKNNSSLGRAYGRKVNYLKVSYDDQFANTQELLINFAKNHIEPVVGGEINFEIVVNAVKGFTKFGSKSEFVDAIVPKDSEGTSSEYALLKATYGAPDEKNTVKVDLSDADVKKHYELETADGTFNIVPEGRYYKETKLGKILEDYEKAIRAETEDPRFASTKDVEALEKFTSDGKTKQYGLLQKIVSLAKEDYTTDGWYVKNGGLSELPSNIRDRLFNIRVANRLDPNTLVDEIPDASMGDYEYEFKDGVKTSDKVTKLPYLRQINGKNVILPAKALSYNADNYNYIYHDRDAKAFYICQVLEAPSTDKLGEASKAYDYELGKKEEVSRQVAKILGTKDSYIKDAYTLELEQFEDFKFYDSSLYDYLKSEYPDLSIFDED